MLITVKERTKEIGIRKALGAPPRSIVGAIMQESIFITTAAGYLGLVAGVGLLSLVASAVPDNEFFGQPQIDFCGRDLRQPHPDRRRGDGGVLPGLRRGQDQPGRGDAGHLMFDVDSFHEIATSLARHKLRTALTAVGVIFGLLIFMAMVAFGVALHDGINRKMTGFAANAVFLWGQRTSEPYAGFAPNRQIVFTNDDIEPLRKLDGVEHVAPRHQLGGFRAGNLVRRGSKVGSYQIGGDYPAFQYISLPLIRAGRFINELDITERRKVAVIGEAVAGELFPPGADPIGQAIEIRGIHFVVVGVFGTKATGQQGDQQVRSIHIPFSTFQQAFNMGNRVAWFALTGQRGVDAKDLEERVYALLRERHNIAPTDQVAIRGWNAGAQFAKTEKMFAAINIVLGIFGLLSLLAGSIGVSNIMLISVRERTKEIGVRKALGARPVQVVAMVVAESVMLTLVAGFLALALGTAGIAYLAERVAALGPDFALGPPRVSFNFAVFASATLVVVGALAGLIPAIRAAAISPVEALRDE
jgi:putative ABC transport system permease protein